MAPNSRRISVHNVSSIYRPANINIRESRRNGPKAIRTVRKQWTLLVDQTMSNVQPSHVCTSSSDSRPDVGARRRGCNSRNFYVPALSISKPLSSNWESRDASSRSARRTRRMRFSMCREVNQRSTSGRLVRLSDPAIRASGNTMIDAPTVREVIRIDSEWKVKNVYVFVR